MFVIAVRRRERSCVIRAFGLNEVIQQNKLTLKPCFNPIWTHCAKHSTAWLRYPLEVENSAWKKKHKLSWINDRPYQGGLLKHVT